MDFRIEGEVTLSAGSKLGPYVPADMASSPERLERFQREAKALEP